MLNILGVKTKEKGHRTLEDTTRNLFEINIYSNAQS